MGRDVRRPGRWDDDRRTPRPGGLVDGDRVIGRISGDAHERAIDGGEQIEGGGRILTRRLGQRVDTDHAGLIDAKVELPPATSAAATVFRGGPLTFPNDGQTRAVEHEMDGLAGRDRSQAAPQMPTAPGERRIVGGGEVEAHHPEHRVQEPFGLAQREMVELASALRTDPHCLRQLEPTDSAIIELREWSRLSEDLTRERVRLANRMRAQLWRYYPQLLDAVDDDVAATWALDLWRRLPTPAAAQRVREATLTTLLTQHRIRRVDAAMLRGRLRTPAITVAPGAAEAAIAHVRLVAERLALINRQLDHARRQLDRLVRQLTEAAPAVASTASVEAEPASSNTPADATILLSLPGIGTGVLATLLAEGSDALRRRDYHALRCLCGVAPVTRRSGKSLLVVRRLAAHDRLRDAAYHWARVAAQRDPASRAKYQALRRRGHGHARALRSVADRLLNIACAMLRDGVCFNPHRAGTATA